MMSRSRTVDHQEQESQLAALAAEAEAETVRRAEAHVRALGAHERFSEQVLGPTESPVEIMVPARFEVPTRFDGNLDDETLRALRVADFLSQRPRRVRGRRVWNPVTERYELEIPRQVRVTEKPES